MKGPSVEDAEYEIFEVKRRRLEESNANIFFANLDNVVKSRLVAFLQFDAWILFPLDVEVWVESDVAFSRYFFDQGEAAHRDLRVAHLIRWLPRLRKVRHVVVQAAISQLQKQSLRELLTSEVRRFIPRHDLSDNTIFLVTVPPSHPCSL